MRVRKLEVGSRAELRQELQRIRVDTDCIGIFTDKYPSFLVKFAEARTPAANILKQTALSFGADVAVHREVITGKVDTSDCLFMGTRRQLKRVVDGLEGQPFGLAGLKKDLRIRLPMWISGNISNPISRQI